MDLEIKRSKRLHNEEGESYLLRDYDGKMCCLGFYAKACGLTDVQIENIEAVSILPEYFNSLPAELGWLYKKESYTGEFENTPEAWLLMKINDVLVGGVATDGSNQRKVVVESEEMREKLITEEFAKHGVNVTFVD